MRKPISGGLQSDRFDVLIIGGATGCGPAVDAAAPGSKTELVDCYRFAEGADRCSINPKHVGGIIDRHLKHLPGQKLKRVNVQFASVACSILEERGEPEDAGQRQARY